MDYAVTLGSRRRQAGLCKEHLRMLSAASACRVGSGDSWRAGRWVPGVWHLSGRGGRGMATGQGPRVCGGWHQGRAEPAQEQQGGCGCCLGSQCGALPLPQGIEPAGAGQAVNGFRATQTTQQITRDGKSIVSERRKSLDPTETSPPLGLCEVPRISGLAFQEREAVVCVTLRRVPQLLCTLLRS